MANRMPGAVRRLSYEEGNGAEEHCREMAVAEGRQASRRLTCYSQYCLRAVSSPAPVAHGRQGRTLTGRPPGPWEEVVRKECRHCPRSGARRDRPDLAAASWAAASSD